VVHLSLAAARKLVEDLDFNINDDKLGEPYFRGASIRRFPLEKDGFRLIKDVKSNVKLAFIDGGNQEIIGGPNFSIQLNRLYADVWTGSARKGLTIPRREFFSSTFSVFRDGEIYFDTHLRYEEGLEEILPRSEDLSFSSMDRSLMSGNRRAEVEHVASITRRFAEWKFAAAILEYLDEGDIIVMDGLLDTSLKQEELYLGELARSAERRGVILTGLSKTSALFTTTGLSLIAAVDKLAQDYEIRGEWYYPIAESNESRHQAVILAVKLNPRSERVYIYEISFKQYQSLSGLQRNVILSQLVRNSADITLPGYPYGLINADRLARVSMDEIEYYRGIIISLMGSAGKLKKFSRFVRARDTHSILNMLIR
jgi:hypothetical protein